MNPSDAVILILVKQSWYQSKTACHIWVFTIWVYGILKEQCNMKYSPVLKIERQGSGKWSYTMF